MRPKPPACAGHALSSGVPPPESLARRRCVKAARTRCQLFLPDPLAGRLARIAQGTGRARSDILAEALEAWLGGRNPGHVEDAIGARLGRIERHLQAVRRQQGLQWEVLARIMRHQILVAAGLPRPDAALEAAAARQFESVIDELASRLAGGEPPEPADRARARVRSWL
jgi:predicted transcriptional regulator